MMLATITVFRDALACEWGIVYADGVILNDRSGYIEWIRKEVISYIYTLELEDNSVGPCDAHGWYRGPGGLAPQWRGEGPGEGAKPPPHVLAYNKLILF